MKTLGRRGQGWGTELTQQDLALPLGFLPEPLSCDRETYEGTRTPVAVLTPGQYTPH